jgi:hypothetical protein
MPRKPSVGPALRKVATPDTRKDIKAERMNPKRTGA